MRVKFYGTRGTIAVGGDKFAKYGGMTTCLRIKSNCLPQGTWLVVDAGNGIIPLAIDGVAAHVNEAKLLLTHYHHDHTNGLPISAWVHMKSVPMEIFGPIYRNIGPKEVLQALMEPPLFPVAFAEVASHLNFKGICHPPGMVFAIHPQGGMKTFRLDEFERAEQRSSAQLSFGKGTKYNISECLIVRMEQTNHPDYTVSYRFEERPTGKVFVFATDHENQCETPTKLRNHFRDADLLVADCQYTEEVYKTRAGYGHGTPKHCVKLAREADVKCLGLTHHDPMSTDRDVDAILLAANDEACVTGFLGEVFACADYQEIEV